MLKKGFFKKIRPAHVLAVLFLCFIFWVGLAPLPKFLSQTGYILENQLGYRNYIKSTNDQYSGMLETYSNFKFLQNKGTYIHFNGLLAKLLRQDMMNERLKLNNGHLFQVKLSSPEPEEIRQAADTIIRFHDAHTGTGGNFLFVMVPSQISKYEDLLPAGYRDTTNATADTFLALLEEAGVPYLDLREELQNDGISITDAYFTTDHHWKPQTGFWAYGKIMEKLAKMGAIGPVDPFYINPDNYIFKTYENTFLGSSGRRTGKYYAGLDDSIFIRPDFDTDISIRVPQRQLELQGRYEDVIYNTDVVHDFENPDFFNENFYGLYGWGDTQITHWRNDSAPEQGKFLLIGESFGNIPFSLMSIYCSSCDEVDVRYFEEDFASYYHSYQPDTVIVELNIYATLSEFTFYDYLEES